MILGPGSLVASVHGSAPECLVARPSMRLGLQGWRRGVGWVHTGVGGNLCVHGCWYGTVLVLALRTGVCK